MRLFLTVFISIITISCSGYAGINPTIEQDVIIELNGMTCEACVQSLTKVFNKEDSVKNVNVNLEDQLIIVDTKDGMDISDEKIKELIEWGGYDLVEITR